MSSSTTLPLGSVLQRSGVKGGDLPRLATNLLQGVVIFADYSNTLTGEPIESRAIGGGTQTAGPGENAAFSLLSAAPGGIVVHDVSIELAVTGDTLLHRGTPLTITGEVVLDPLQLGGVDTRSRLVRGKNSSSPAPAVTYPSQTRVVRTGVRWYIPPGQALFIPGPTTNDLHVTLTWRELPEALGSP